MNVFVVEDSASIRRLLVRRLESLPGVTVVGEATGQDQALALIEWLQPDIVLLDLSLATGSGLQVLARLRRAGFAGRIMVLTAQFLEAYREACQDAGADGFYDKASGLETLFDDLGGLLEQERGSPTASAQLHLLRDGLTGACNQRALLERLDQATKMAARDDQELAVYVLVLRGLAAQPAAADQAEALLCEVARRLAGCITPADLLARHAEQQFSLVLTRVESAAEAALFARRLNTLLAQPYALPGQTLNLEIELGLALFPRDAVAAHALLTLAEADAYGALKPRSASVFSSLRP